jgi:hypothetical protein
VYTNSYKAINEEIEKKAGGRRGVGGEKSIFSVSLNGI